MIKKKQKTIFIIKSLLKEEIEIFRLSFKW